MLHGQVIAAEGEQKASRALREAAEVIAESPSALQLRFGGARGDCEAKKRPVSYTEASVMELYTESYF